MTATRAGHELLECVQYGELYRVMKSLRGGDAAICARVRRRKDELFAFSHERITVERLMTWPHKLAEGDYIFHETRMNDWAHWRKREGV